MKTQLLILMTLLIPIVMFAQPCTVNDATGCVCEDGSTDCYLLPNIKLSYDLLADPAQNPESPGELRISVSTPNVGHGPLRVIATDNFVCGVDTFFNSNITVCPDGSDPSQLVLQRLYYKQGNTMLYADRWAGTMTYHPTHNHSHFDDWGVYSLRIPDANEPNPLNWTMVSEGAKLSFCLMDFGSCTFYNGHCRDDNNSILTNSDFPNYGLGGGQYSCGVTNQGISVGWTDIYDYNLDGMHITIPDGVCNGDYAVVVQVDPNNLLMEENDNDNLVVVPFTLTQQTDCTNNNECNDNPVNINITLDNYPQETSWAITDENGATVASSNGTYSGQADGSTITENVCLPSGCFNFTINDSQGDGICCGYGNGSYTITDADGNALASGGEFGSSETKNICITQAPCAGNGGDNDSDGICANVDCNDNNANVGTQQAPGTACNDSNPDTTNDVIQQNGCTCAGTPVGGGGCNDNPVTVAITLDNYPEETSWTITNENGATVASSNGTYSGLADGSTVTESVCLPNGCFNFTINDSYGDGICCAQGNGSYTITDADGNVLASGGEFSSSETKNICVTQAPCAGNGGDNDGDGICANVDCNDNNANVGAQQTPGTACNDSNPATTGDIIQQDGCTCAGTPDNSGCNGYPVDINITLDNYPQETSWTITNNNGAILTYLDGTYSGQTAGSTITHNLCLPDECFNFTMNDSYGDGICCAQGNGYYTVSDANGNILASGGNFGSSETKNICLDPNRVENAIKIINIFPNPSDTYINIDLHQVIKTLNSNDIELTIFSLNGKLVYQNEMQLSSMLRLNIESLSSSQMYLLNLRTKDGRIFREKFVKF